MVTCCNSLSRLAAQHAPGRRRAHQRGTAGPGRADIDLHCARRLQTHPTRGGFKLRGRRTLFEREHQAPLLVEKILALAPERLGLVAVLDGDDLLPHGQNEPGGQHEAAYKQADLPPERARVALTAEMGVRVLLGHSSHLFVSLG